MRLGAIDTSRWDVWTKAGAIIVLVAIASAIVSGIYGWIQFDRYQSFHVIERAHLAADAVAAVRANQDVAEWTYSLLFVGVVSSALSVAGIVVVGLTLRASREAVAAAQADTKATREIGENQNRAYLRATKARLEFIGSGNWRVRIYYENSGMTPAINIRHAICVGSRTEKTHLGSELLFPRHPDFHARRPIPAGKSDEFTCEIPDYRQAVQSVLEPGVALDSPTARFLIIVGAVIYEDVFHNVFRTQFEFHFKGAPPADGGYDLEWGKRTKGMVYEPFEGVDRVHDYL